eukprot:g2795.t1
MKGPFTGIPIKGCLTHRVVRVDLSRVCLPEIGEYIYQKVHGIQIEGCLTIEGEGTINLTNDGTIIDSGSLTLSDGITLIHNGNLTIEKCGVVTLNDVTVAVDSFTIEGTLILAGEASFAALGITEPLMEIKKSGKLTLTDPTATINNTNIDNYGYIEAINGGLIGSNKFQNFGTLIVTGGTLNLPHLEFNNYETLTTQPTATADFLSRFRTPLTNEESGVINNFGNLIVCSSGEFVNLGTLNGNPPDLRPC